MRGRWILVLSLGALVVLAGGGVAGWYADRLWFTALGAAPLWRQRFWLTALARGGSGLAAGAFVFVNLYVVRKSVVSLVLPRRLANLEIGEEVPGRDLVAAAALIAALFGWLLALPADSWQQLALVLHGLPFGEADPYLEADLGFYVYQLPFETALYFMALITVLLTAALVTFFYALTPSLRWDRGRVYLSQYARRHLLALAAVLLIITAWSFRLDEFRVLLSGGGADGAFSFTDHRAVIPASGTLALLALGSAFSLLVFGWIGQFRVATTALLVMLAAGLALQALLPLYVRRVAVIGDAAVREQPYVRVRAEYSRRAFAVDRIRGAGAGLRYETARAAAAAISSWDPSVLLHAAARRERGDAMTIGWSAGAGALTALIPVRPAAAAGAADSAPARWTLMRLLAAAADPSGEMIAIPPEAGAGDALPPVLIHEGAPDELLVLADTLGVLPAPALTTTPARLAFAWSRQRLRLLTAELPGPHPRAIALRDVRRRVAALAPFLTQGTSVAPVLANDSLWWVIDLYAASGSYPLSRHDSLGDGEYSYIQHAATAIVNAHSGAVMLLRDDVLDPVAKSWSGLFPSLFAERTDVPAAILAALPPASDGAQAQGRMLARYGRRGETPPSGELAAAGPDSLPAPIRSGPYALPQSSAVAWCTVVLDAGDHIVGVVVATGGAARATYWLPLARRGARWSVITGQLKTALDSALSAPPGARLQHGVVRAAAVGDGVTFTQSVFATRSDEAATLLRSAVLDGGALVTGRSVSQALGVPALGADTGAITPAAFRKRVGALYAQMRVALQRGDWPAFGRAYDALGVLLARRERAP